MKHDVSLDETSQVRSIKRAADIVRTIGGFAGGAKLTEIAQAVGLHKATVSRILQTLVAERFVGYHDEEQIYFIGTELVQIAMSSQAAADFRATQYLEKFSTPLLSRLRDATGETVVLVARHGDMRVNVAVVLGSFELIASPKVGAQLPLHAGGPGKILLSVFSPPELEAYVRRSKLISLTSRTISSVEDLTKELRQVRRSGYATSSGEATEGQESIAAPILKHGVIAAAINLIVPSVRFSGSRRKELIPQVRKIAEEISQLVETSEED